MGVDVEVMPTRNGCTLNLTQHYPSKHITYKTAFIGKAAEDMDEDVIKDVVVHAFAPVCPVCGGDVGCRQQVHRLIELVFKPVIGRWEEEEVLEDENCSFTFVCSEDESHELDYDLVHDCDSIL